MAAALFFLPFRPVPTTNGLPAPGARVFFYQSGTLTPAPVYADVNKTTPLTNPVVANGAGRLPTIYLDSATIYRAIIKDRQGVTLADIDAYVPGTAAGAELLAPYSDSAAASAIAAAGSATTAGTNATAAAGSAATATTQASNAATSAGTAATKASEANTSAQTAASKATEASGSAANALSFRNDAVSARVAAETARTGAETAQTGAQAARTAAETAAANAAAAVSAPIIAQLIGLNIAANEGKVLKVVGGVLAFAEDLTGGGSPDTTPDAFVFTDATDVALSATQTSNTITVAGLGSGQSATVTITGGTYSKNGGGYVSTAGTAANGDTFAVRHTASASNSTATNTTLTIGGVSDTFTSTTLAASGLDPGISAPTLTLATANTTYPPQFDIGLDDTAQVGDVIRLQWKLGSSDFTTPTGQATNTIDAGEASANAATFTGLSSISTGTHRFRSRVERGSAYGAWSNVVTQGPDDVAPTITSANPSGTYPELTPITGTLTANEAVTWSKSGTNAAAVTLNTSTGAWSYTPDYETVPSPSWTFTATDAAGNATNQVVSMTITDVVEATFGMTETAAPATLNTGFSGGPHTFAAQSLGAADPSRRILVSLMTSGAAPTGVKVITTSVPAGVALTKTAHDGGGDNELSFWEGPVPAGTSGDIEVTCVNPSAVGIKVVRVVGAAGAPTTIAKSWSFENSPQSMAVTTPTGGATYIAQRLAPTSGTASWTNAIGQSQASNFDTSHVSAIRTTAGAATVSVSGFGNANCSGLAASYAP